MKIVLILSLAIIFAFHTRKSNSYSDQAECLIELNIDEQGRVHYDENIIFDQRLGNLIRHKLKSCKTEFRLKISSPMPCNYKKNFEKVEKVIIASIEQVQNEYSLKKYGRPLDSLSINQFKDIQKIYPDEYTADFCCTDH